MMPFNKNLKPLARRLRGTMTDAELLLWSRIRRKQLKGVQFYRQKNIGDYIVDFYCPQACLVIELDGGQHYQEEDVQKDRERDTYLQQLGLKVLRFSNHEVLTQTDAVVEYIYERL